MKLVLAAVLFLIGLGPAGAAVRLDMFVGFDGLVPLARWFPIVFEVSNDGPGFNGEIEVVPGQFNSALTRKVKVELPSGTTKRLVMPNFAAASYNPTWQARLRDEKGVVRAEAGSLRVRRYNEWVMPLAGALTRSLPALPEFKGRQEEFRPAVARLQASVFPDNPLALEGLDTIYLSSERAADLKANQAGALIAWLHAGGHLVLGVEQVGHLSGPAEWLARLLPCDLTGLTTRPSHGGLQDWLNSHRRVNGLEDNATTQETVAGRRSAGPGTTNVYQQLPVDERFEETPLQAATCRLLDGRVLMGPADAPLGIIARRGRGQITVLTFAPELEPFRSWKNAPYFWARLIDVPPAVLATENFNAYGGHPVDALVGAMIDSDQVRKLPVFWLLLLLVVYLVVIGPLDQYWLKKINRQMLTWLTFPAYVLFFSLLIYFIGYKLRAGETEWNELHFLDVNGGGDVVDWRGRSYGSIYSPVNARYRLASEEPFAALRGEFTGNYGSGQDTGRGALEQTPAGYQVVAPVPVWTSQLFLSDWFRRGPAPVRVTLDPTDIVVENSLEAGLTAVRLVVDGQVLELGGVPARGRRSFGRRGARSTTLTSFVESRAHSFQHVVSVRGQAFGDTATSRLRNEPDTAAAISFVSLVNTPNSAYNNFTAGPGFDLASLVERGDAVLLAWVADYSPTKPINQFPAKLVHRNTLLRVLVPQAVAPNPR